MGQIQKFTEMPEEDMNADVAKNEGEQGRRGKATKPARETQRSKECDTQDHHTYVLERQPSIPPKHVV